MMYKALHLSTACFVSPSKAGFYPQRTVGSVQPAQTHLHPRLQRGDSEVTILLFYPVTLFTESSPKVKQTNKQTKIGLQAGTSRKLTSEQAAGSSPEAGPRERDRRESLLPRPDPHLPVSIGGVVPPVGLLVVVGLVGMGAATAPHHMGAHLVAQVGARVGPRQPAQGVDPRVGAAVDAHGGGGAPGAAARGEERGRRGKRRGD